MPSPGRILQLKIALRYIEPPIWRRVLVRDDWLLGDLHPVFVRVMGWAGYHLPAGGLRQFSGLCQNSPGAHEGRKRRRSFAPRLGWIV